jgi:hypothetical protein
MFIPESEEDEDIDGVVERGLKRKVSNRLCHRF